MYALVFGVTFLKRFVQEVTTKHFRGYLYAFERNAEVTTSLCVVIFVKLHFSTKKKKKKKLGHAQNSPKSLVVVL